MPADLNPLLAHSEPKRPTLGDAAEAHARMTSSSSDEFLRLAARVRKEVEAELARTLDEAKARAQAAGPRAHDVVAALAELATRGGKRLRAVLVAAGYEACDGEGGASTVALAGVAVELLQAYLLIHDDWMDQDDVRRGGPRTV